MGDRKEADCKVSPSPLRPPSGKLGLLRVTELKVILHELGLSKQGRKQELIDRILALLSDDKDAVSKLNGRTKKLSIEKEAVLELIDDTYRQFQQKYSSGSTSKNKNECKDGGETSTQPEVKVRCLCGSSLITESMIKCEDPQCNVMQHISCVIIPEKADEGGALELPSNFYCELCRLKRADPFLYSVCHLLLPVKIVSAEPVSAEVTCNVQSMERTFPMSKANEDMLQNPEYDLQVWCILLNDTTPFRLQWPVNADLQVNDTQIRLVSRPITQYLGANGRDDGPIISVYTHAGVNKLLLSRMDSRTFCIGVRIAQRRTVEQVLSLVPREADGESFDDALSRVRRCLGGDGADDSDSDADVKIVADSVIVNLRCPMSGLRMKSSGRFRPCIHMGCFDLESFVELNQRSRKWQCPICLKNYSLEDLIIDPYFNRIAALMLNCEDDVAEIDVRPNGSWRVRKCETEDLGQWHLPDAEFTIAPKSQMPGPDAESMIKNERSNEDSHLEVGMRKSINGHSGIRSSEQKGKSIEGRKNSFQMLADAAKSMGDKGSENADSIMDRVSTPLSQDLNVIYLSDSDDVVVLDPPAVAAPTVAKSPGNSYESSEVPQVEAKLDLSIPPPSLDLLYSVSTHEMGGFWDIQEQFDMNQICNTLGNGSASEVGNDPAAGHHLSDNGAGGSLPEAEQQNGFVGTTESSLPSKRTWSEGQQQEPGAEQSTAGGRPGDRHPPSGKQGVFVPLVPEQRSVRQKCVVVPIDSDTD